MAARCPSTVIPFAAACVLGACGSSRGPGDAADMAIADAFGTDSPAIVDARADVPDAAALDAGGREQGTWREEAELALADPAGVAGQTVAIDGDLGVVGAVGDPPGVAVLRRDPAGWRVDATLSVAGDRPAFGRSVAVRRGTIVVGSPWEAAAGAVYTFERAAGGWSRVSTLTRAESAFGSSVALSGDRLAVGSPLAADEGRIHLQVRDGEGGWREEVRLSVPHTVQLGEGVALHEQVAVAGEQQSAHLFELDDVTGWHYVAPLPSVEDPFGSDGHERWSVAASEGTVAVGEPCVVGNGGWGEPAPCFGAVRVFRRSGDGWTEEALLGGSEDGDVGSGFGCLVAAGRDTLLVGDCSDSSPILLFERQDGWARVASLEPAAALGLSADGDLAIARRTGTSPGVRIYRRE